MAKTKKLTQSSGLEKELDLAKQSYARLAADFANYQKRIEQEKTNWTKQANHQLLTQLFPIFDNFYLAIRHNPLDLLKKPHLSTDEQEKTRQYIEGVAMIEKQLEDTLSQIGLSKVPTQGQSFDPTAHEAISYEPSAEVPRDSVIAEVEAGWQIDGVVIKPAKVRVSKGKASS